MIAQSHPRPGQSTWDDLRGLELTDKKATTAVAESGTTHVTFCATGPPPENRTRRLAPRGFTLTRDYPVLRRVGMCSPRTTRNCIGMAPAAAPGKGGEGNSLRATARNRRCRPGTSVQARAARRTQGPGRQRTLQQRDPRADSHRYMHGVRHVRQRTVFVFTDPRSRTIRKMLLSPPLPGRLHSWGEPVVTPNDFEMATGSPPAAGLYVPGSASRGHRPRVSCSRSWPWIGQVRTVCALR